MMIEEAGMDGPFPAAKTPILNAGAVIIATMTVTASTREINFLIFMASPSCKSLQRALSVLFIQKDGGYRIKTGHILVILVRGLATYLEVLLSLAYFIDTLVKSLLVLFLKG